VSKGKNFFYRINPLAVMAQVGFETNREQWFIQFFSDLINDDPGTAKIPLAAEIIKEAHNFRELRSKAGKASVKQKGTYVQHMLKDVQPEAVAVTETETIQKPYKEILDDLNSKGGFSYRPGKAVNEFINGRLAEGFTKEDFFHVHTVMVAKWKDDEKMSQYLRPSTLYRPTHFQEYLNQKLITSKCITPDWM
jgi:uncharacterized phage protein (TIGR02220 family)